MARAIITLEDGETPGSVSVRLEFDPPVVKDEPGTAAQHAAVNCINALRGDNPVEDLSEEDGPYGENYYDE
jgi:hypothetical protein